MRWILGYRFGKVTLIFTILSLLILLAAGCRKETEEGDDPLMNKPLSAAEEYFLEVAFGTEFGGANSSVIRTWEEDMVISLHSDEKYPSLDEELDQIITEINALSETIALRRAVPGEASNFRVYLSDAETYGQYEANAIDDLSGNWGYVYVYWSGSVIDRGSMYVDTERNSDLDCMKHLMREELTQSLGILQDSNRYPESIFYQPWTCGFEYASIDREVISFLLSTHVSAGDSRTDVENYFRGN